MSKIKQVFEYAIDRLLPVGVVVRNLPYVMIFKTTHWCWYNCPHCCESAGKNRPAEFIPVDVIKYYTDAATSDPKFTKEMVLTGGEIMASYKFDMKNYVPELANYITERGIRLDIKTNGAWIRNKDLRTKIVPDLININERNSGQRRLPYQLSLSLDKYHPNALENTYEIICELARRNKNKPTILVHISGFTGQDKIYKELLAKLSENRNIKIEDAYITAKSGNAIPLHVINRCVALRPSFGAVLFAGGRAQNLPEATPAANPTFEILNQDAEVLMAFDAAGNVTLGENSGRKITVPWRDKDGNPRDLPAIRRDLVQRARYEQLRHNMINLKKIFVK
ncbi:MAG: radical SAM protein [Alphaproteobacteria bacterium]|nr:radical SAM protein [Alphaproteobacteria bacterium]